MATSPTDVRDQLFLPQALPSASTPEARPGADRDRVAELAQAVGGGSSLGR